MRTASGESTGSSGRRKTTCRKRQSTRESLHVGMPSALLRLSLDDWAVVFSHVRHRDLVRSFDALHDAGVFGGVQKLDAFWSVMTLSRDVARAEERTVARRRRNGARTLHDMGVLPETAHGVTARGSLDVATQLLGWL